MATACHARIARSFLTEGTAEAQFSIRGRRTASMEHTQRSSAWHPKVLGWERRTDHILQSQLMASMLALPFVRRPKPKPTLSPVQTCSSSSAPRLREVCASRCAALRAVEGRSGGGQTLPGGIGVEVDVWRLDIHDDDAVITLSRFRVSKEELEVCLLRGRRRWRWE